MACCIRYPVLGLLSGVGGAEYVTRGAAWEKDLMRILRMQGSYPFNQTSIASFSVISVTSTTSFFHNSRNSLTDLASHRSQVSLVSGANVNTLGGMYQVSRSQFVSDKFYSKNRLFGFIETIVGLHVNLRAARKCLETSHCMEPHVEPIGAFV